MPTVRHWGRRWNDGLVPVEEAEALREAAQATADWLGMVQTMYHALVQGLPTETRDTCEAGMCGEYRKHRDLLNAALAPPVQPAAAPQCPGCPHPVHDGSCPFPGLPGVDWQCNCRADIPDLDADQPVDWDRYVDRAKIRRELDSSSQPAAAPRETADRMTRERLTDWLVSDDGRRYDVFGLWVQGKRDTAWLVDEIAPFLAPAAASAEPREKL